MFFVLLSWIVRGNSFHILGKPCFGSFAVKLVLALSEYIRELCRVRTFVSLELNANKLVNVLGREFVIQS